jgi:flagellar biosynthesis/type III secretory pathway protein FliH
VSFLLWQRDGEARIASSRLVLRAAEVPLLGDAQQLRDKLESLRRDQDQHIAAVTAQAQAQGRAHGLVEGQREAGEQLASTLTTLVQTSAQERERLRGQTACLALQVVRKLLGQFAEDALLVALAETAAADLLPTLPLSLVVHPDVCQAVRERLAAGADASTGAASGLRCEVRSDPSCARDSCRVETEHGSIDASLEAQLARLEAAWRANDVAVPR